MINSKLIILSTGLKQRVCLHSVCSSYSELRVGLPQGSLLRPLLFNVFINDLNYAVPDVSLKLNADDMALYASDVSPIALQFVVNRGLSRLSEWFDTNYLLINNAKTQAVPIGPCKYDFDLTLILLFKYIRNIGPKYIRDYFSIRETSDNLKGNGVNLCIPKFHLNFMRNTFTYNCAQLWNKLPEDVKLADDVNIFKSKLRSTQL